jgi:hypothetical protein
VKERLLPEGDPSPPRINNRMNRRRRRHARHDRRPHQRRGVRLEARHGDALRLVGLINAIGNQAARGRVRDDLAGFDLLRLRRYGLFAIITSSSVCATFCPASYGLSAFWSTFSR